MEMKIVDDFTQVFMITYFILQIIEFIVSYLHLDYQYFITKNLSLWERNILVDLPLNSRY